MYATIVTGNSFFCYIGVRHIDRHYTNIVPSHLFSKIVKYYSNKEWYSRKIYTSMKEVQIWKFDNYWRSKEINSVERMFITSMLLKFCWNIVVRKFKYYFNIVENWNLFKSPNTVTLTKIFFMYIKNTYYNIKKVISGCWNYGEIMLK